MIWPGPEIYEAAARAWVADSADAAHADWSQRDAWPASLQDNRNLHRIVDAIYPLIYRAGHDQAIRILAHDLRIVLDQQTLHAHRRPGLWDVENHPKIADTPCVECAARDRLRAALDVVEKESPPWT